jgi:hypothetical protein
MTDAVAGNWSPIVLNEGKNPIAFVSYSRTITASAPRAEGTAAHRRQRRLRRPGPIIDFQAPLQHTLVPDNQRKKGRFEKM